MAEGLANKATPGHRDAYLNALLDYTSGFYGAAVAAGMKPREAVDAIQHVERAARGLHAIALNQPPWRPDREAVARIVDERTWRLLDRRYGDNPLKGDDALAKASLRKADAILALQPPTEPTS